MNVLGLLAGSGNILFEAKKQGLHVLGNIEPRAVYKNAPWVWGSNFPDSRIIIKETDPIPKEWYRPDLVLGHPPCAKFSSMGQVGISIDGSSIEERKEWRSKRSKDLGLIPFFVKTVNELQPKAFALDNLPKMLESFSKEQWVNSFPGYTLTFLTIANWDYGSPQKRVRLWIVGTRDGFKFKAPKKRLKGPQTTWEAISDLPWEPWIDIEELDHIHHPPGGRPLGAFQGELNGEIQYIRKTDEMAVGWFSIPPLYLWPYKTKAGRVAKKVGHVRLVSDHICRTLTGRETLRHPLSGWPLTIRERARMMGWPDDFRLADGVEVNRTNIYKLAAVTGRAVPNEFIRYLIPQLVDQI